MQIYTTVTIKCWCNLINSRCALFIAPLLDWVQLVDLVANALACYIFSETQPDGALLVDLEVFFTSNLDDTTLSAGDTSLDPFIPVFMDDAILLVFTIPFAKTNLFLVDISAYTSS